MHDESLNKSDSVHIALGSSAKSIYSPLKVETNRNQIKSLESTTPTKSFKSIHSPEKSFQTPKRQQNKSPTHSEEPYDPFEFSSKLKANQIETKKMSLSSTSSSSLSELLSKKVEQKQIDSASKLNKSQEKTKSPNKKSPFQSNQKIEKKLDYSSYEEDFDNSINSKSSSSSN